MVKYVEAKVLGPNEVPMVKEFLDVFLEELLGMAPNREVKFYIDLAPSLQAMSIPLHRMAPTELWELKVQLQDMLDKDFIPMGYLSTLCREERWVNAIMCEQPTAQKVNYS